MLFISLVCRNTNATIAIFIDEIKFVLCKTHEYGTEYDGKVMMMMHD